MTQQSLPFWWWQNTQSKEQILISKEHKTPPKHMHTHFQIFNMLPLNICIHIAKHIKICSTTSSLLSSTKTIKQLKPKIRELKLKSLPIFWKTFCTTNQPFVFINYYYLILIFSILMFKIKRSNSFLEVFVF